MTTANPVDEEFISTTGIHLIAGNDFIEQDVKDATREKQEDKIYHFILNESAAKVSNGESNQVNNDNKNPNLLHTSMNGYRSSSQA
ncbi:hypothetical protein [Acidovorax sp. BLS4]|uniref:hypothetical protein n=1 Tax=Acidovorax sp. BLS4 TaxID=3273430 RepID=UPI002943F41A|nr:hypothetical protein [Paracidovorax avenae]WOI45593.1 hypothetical protein R1Z03_24570 [Paracidovorax avenae]